jgi:acetoacetyl-CoA synthetase
MSQPLWQPGETAVRSMNLTRFMIDAEQSCGRKLTNYEELHTFSVRDPGTFWRLVWDRCGIKGDPGAAPFLIDGDKVPGARFFPSGTLNFAENLLAGAMPASRDALVFRGEDKLSRRVSWGELRRQTAQLQGLLRHAGIKAGDRVAAMLPNVPEAIVGMLAASSLGAVWSSCSPDFGVQGVLDRFGQIAPRLLIACDGYWYNGKAIDTSDKVIDLAKELPSVERIIVTSYLGKADAVVSTLNASVLKDGRIAETWDTAVIAAPAEPMTFEPFPFDHPLYILFSSGTTGVPKCIVHSAGGTLIKHLCEQQLQCDFRPGDRVMYFTTLGWMMWNWLVSGLASGVTLLLYDGSPFHPSARVLWDYAQDEHCTHFGTSAKYIDALKKAGARPMDTHDLSALRVILSTGSVLVPESFDHVYEAIKKEVHLASMSGGTDIVGCFVGGIPGKPVWRGEIQGSGLGMGVAVVDELGNVLPHGKGELVCTVPFPSMPVGFWNDPDGKKYRAAYFERFPGLWHHGDFAEWTENGGMIIHGRSDATLNPGGVRIGTAEIYRQVEQLPEIKEAIVIGQDWDSDVRVVLFVITQDGVTLDDALREKIKKAIRTGASPRHVPARIVQVSDIPRTKSGKITELAVREIVHGREVKNKEALANPEALDLYRGIPELAE